MNSGSTGRFFSAPWLKSTAVVIIGLVIGIALWSATAPNSLAQAMTPAQMIQGALPQGQTLAGASKADLLAAVSAAIRKSPRAAAQIAGAAAAARPELAKDILQVAFRAAGTGDCARLASILRTVSAAAPDQSSALTTLALELAPNCSAAFQTGGGGGGEGEGNYGNAPGNQNPPPGTAIGGGGGGQGTVVAVCFNGTTRFFSPQGAEDFLRNNPGATVGPCVVTPVTNP